MADAKEALKSLFEINVSTSKENFFLKSKINDVTVIMFCLQTNFL